MIRNIIVSDGRGANPAKLHTQIDPVRLSKGMGLALTSIAYGEIYNVHEGNNKVYFALTEIPIPNDELGIGSTLGRKNKKGKPGQIYKVEIPSATYTSTYSIVDEIVGLVNKKITALGWSIKKIFLKMYGSILGRSFALTPENVIIHVNDVKGLPYNDCPWGLINVTDNIKSRTQISNRTLSEEINPAILYVNIVENSYINGNKSRSLAILPLNSRQGYSFYEFIKPVYVPIEVHQFSEIFLEIRDLDSKFVRFNPKWNTLVSMHLKAINRGE